MVVFRKERISEAIRKVASEKLVKDKGLVPGGIVTISKVDLSPDLTFAKIFFTIFPTHMEGNEAEKLMAEHAPEFRHEISKKLNLRKTPRVKFCFDKNTEYAAKVDSLLA